MYNTFNSNCNSCCPFLSWLFSGGCNNNCQSVCRDGCGNLRIVNRNACSGCDWLNNSNRCGCARNYGCGFNAASAYNANGCGCARNYGCCQTAFTQSEENTASTGCFNYYQRQYGGSCRSSCICGN